MTPPVFALYLSCLFLGEMAQTTELNLSSSDRLERSFASVKTGDTLILPCIYKSNVSPRLYWYKQALGKKPQHMSTYYKYGRNYTFTEKFQNNPRFTLDTENGKNNLIIKDLKISDSATYYCVSVVANKLDFLESTFVNMKGSGVNIPASIRQSSSEIIQPGGSVTLNCTVHTGTCDGEHSVYWFKNSQEESHPGLIYTHGGRNDQCERKDDTQTHTCVYNLLMESLNVSHAGTYYCAVASCGHILFGNGAKLDIEKKVDYLTLVYVLSGALIFTSILVVILAASVYKMQKTNGLQSPDSQPRFPPSGTENAEGYQDEDNLHYAALSVNPPNRSRRQRSNTQNECVYSSVRQ